MSNNPKVTICMPVFNEEEGIEGFVEELLTLGSGTNFQIVIVDDCSTDGTSKSLAKLKARFGKSVVTYANEANLGHGPTTSKSLRFAVETSPDLVCAIDGDGQFPPMEVIELIALAWETKSDVLIGARQGRQEPVFRKVITLLTRVLVYSRSGQRVMDANSPLRVYKPSALIKLLELVPRESLTPNILLSQAMAQMNLRIKYAPITSLVRRGTSSTGTMWGNGRRPDFLPSRKFVLFCWRAALAWFRESRDVSHKIKRNVSKNS